MNADKLLDEIIKSARVGETLDEPEGPFKSFGLENQIIFDKEQFTAFEGAISKLYETSSEIASTISREVFEKRIVRWLRPVIVDGEDRKTYRWRDFEAELIAIDKGRVQVFRAVQGVTMFQGVPPLQLGPFTLWSVLHHRHLLKKAAPKIRGDSWSESDRKYVIGVEFFVRDSRKALELADAQFEMFEQVIAFFIERDERYEVGVLSYRGQSVKRALMETDVASVENLMRAGPIHEINLSHKFFNQPSEWTLKVWNLCHGVNEDKLARRIKLAISWLGQSCMESHLPTAFVKAAISLEILLGQNDREIISPSILSHISECVALVIGETVDDRIALEKDVKRLYGQRSKIVHEGRNNINTADLYLLLRISKLVIKKILMNKDMAGFKEPDELFKYLKRRKYGAQ